MRAVLYADDMEPITVLDLTPFAKKFLEDRGMVRLPVRVPPSMTVDFTSGPSPQIGPLSTVTIVTERFMRHGRVHTMLFTKDEESALLLKCAFLPGQLTGVQERERVAFARGVMDALARLGRS